MNYSRKMSAICKRCLRSNKRCIKYDPYIGFCASNDRQELIEILKNKKKKCNIL